MIHSRDPDLVSRTWRRFGLRNGSQSLREMRARIAEYQPLSRYRDPVIANMILINLVLLPEDEPFESKGREIAWIDGRDLSQDDANAYLLSLRLSASRLAGLADRPQAQVHAHSAAEGLSDDERVTLAETNAWSTFVHRCAVTGWRLECALEVTFLRPPDRGGPATVENTLLLRKDLAALQHKDLIAFNNEGKLLVSTMLADLDSRVYGELGDLSLKRHMLARFSPDIECIRWRLDRFHRRQVDPNWDGEQ